MAIECSHRGYLFRLVMTMEALHLFNVMAQQAIVSATVTMELKYHTQDFNLKNQNVKEVSLYVNWM